MLHKMKAPSELKSHFFTFLKGLTMGAANKVPGVSGGIVAFVWGFYERFISSLKKMDVNALALLRHGQFKEFKQYTDFVFLGYLVMGMVFSYFSVSKILDYFLKTRELYVWSVFFGMIIGSVYYISKSFGGWNSRNRIFGLMGLILGISISFLSPAQENDHWLFVFFCGMISVSGMTLPGLSGSFILMLMGNYVLLLVESVNALFDTLTEIVRFDFGFIYDTARIDALFTLGIFTLGSVVGLITLSHFIGYLLKRFHDQTTASIIGFITGSLGVVWPWKEADYLYDASGNVVTDSYLQPVVIQFTRYIPKLNDAQNLWALAFILSGIALLVFLERYGAQKK
jgi:putative membrane protein